MLCFSTLYRSFLKTLGSRFHKGFVPTSQLVYGNLVVATQLFNTFAPKQFQYKLCLFSTTMPTRFFLFFHFFLQLILVNFTSNLRKFSAHINSGLIYLLPNQPIEFEQIALIFVTGNSKINFTNY